MPVSADHESPWRRNGISVLAEGEAGYASSAEIPVRNRTSYYADPVAWLIAEAVENALRICPANVCDAAQDVATIAVSDFCTTLTMRQIAAQVPSGRLSPLRFAAAPPGAIGGLPAMVFGFMGPSLTLTAHPDSGLGPASILAGSWLGSGLASYVVLAWHAADATGRHQAAAVILAAADRRPPVSAGAAEDAR